MSFRFPPIPDVFLNTEVVFKAIEKNDFGNDVVKSEHSSKFRVESDKQLIKSEEGLMWKHTICLFCNDLDFAVNTGDNATFQLTKRKQVSGKVVDVGILENPDGSIHHYEIMLGEVIEHDL